MSLPVPPSITSLPEPPVNVSSPAPPDRLSLPAPAFSQLALLSPVSVSLKLDPITPSTVFATIVSPAASPPMPVPPIVTLTPLAEAE